MALSALSGNLAGHDLNFVKAVFGIGHVITCQADVVIELQDINRLGAVTLLNIRVLGAPGAMPKSRRPESIRGSPRDKSRQAIGALWAPRLLSLSVWDWTAAADEAGAGLLA
jgi:hypothetical protein